MSVQIVELEKLLAQMIAEHRVLLAAVVDHTEAMRGFDLGKINAAMDEVENSRKRILSHETRRRLLMQQIGRSHKFSPDLSLTQIIEAVPEHAKSLTKLRNELRNLTAQVSSKTSVSGRIASAMIGHLNTVVRIVAGAMQQTAVYTKQGVPSYSSRIGVIEAVG